MPCRRPAWGHPARSGGSGTNSGHCGVRGGVGRVTSENLQDGDGGRRAVAPCEDSGRIRSQGTDRFQDATRRPPRRRSSVTSSWSGHRGWREQSNLASGGCRHNPWGLVPGPNVRLPAGTPSRRSEVLRTRRGGCDTICPFIEELASGPRGPARAAARRGHAPSPILWVLPCGCRARSSVGERLLHTQEVGGSKPPAPTTS